MITISFVSTLSCPLHTLLPRGFIIHSSRQNGANTCFAPNVLCHAQQHTTNLFIWITNTSFFTSDVLLERRRLQSGRRSISFIYVWSTIFPGWFLSFRKIPMAVDLSSCTWRLIFFICTSWCYGWCISGVTGGRCFTDWKTKKTAVGNGVELYPCFSKFLSGLCFTLLWSNSLAPERESSAG